MEWLNQLPPNKKATAEKVKAAAIRHGVPVDLALSMAMQESGFDQSKASGTGPIGVMQVGRAVGKDFKINRKNEDQNIDAGIRYMRQMLDKHGNIEDALVAYHDGPNSSYFKGGAMSPEATNHINKVKGYMGMASPTKAAPSKTESEFDISIEDVDPVQTFAEDAAIYGGRLRDIGDLSMGVAGAGVGYGVGKSREMSRHQKELHLSAQRLALQQQKAAQEAAERAAAANSPFKYGSGTENWKNTEYAEPIARQIVNPLDKKEAERLAQMAIAKQRQANQLFPHQVPAAPGSMLTIPIVTGGKTQMPAPQVAPAAPQPPAAPPLNQMPAMDVMNAPGRGSTAASAAMGGVTGAQAYNAAMQAREGNYGEAARSGLSALQGLFSTFARKPWVKAITGAGSIGTGFGPEAYQYFKDYFGSSEPAPQPPQVPVQKAEGGLAHFAGGGRATLGK